MYEVAGITRRIDHYKQQQYKFPSEDDRPTHVFGTNHVIYHYRLKTSMRNHFGG